MRIPVIFPLLCYLVALVLSFLLLFAGHKQGFMEDYAIVRLNTSALGYNLVDNTFNFLSDENTDDQQDDNNDGGNLLDDLIDGVKGTIKNITDSVQDYLNDVGNEVAERLAEDLGISEWYSIHVMAGCQGDFSPNATNPNAGFNTTGCSNSTVGYRINITELLDHELSVGPASLNFADLGVPPEISDQLDMVSDILKAAAIFYILGVAFTGIGMLFSAATLAIDTSPPQKRFMFFNITVAMFATLVLLVSSTIATIGARKAARKITERGAIAGMSATAGEKFITLSWVAFALTVAAAVFYAADVFWAFMSRRKRGLTEKSIRH